jgi:HK97 family phage prohead protease
MPDRPAVEVISRYPFLAVARPRLLLPEAKAATLEEVQHTWLPTEWKAASDDGSGEVEGYAAVFGNVDLQGDMILRGAFKRTLAHWRNAKGRIPLVDGHMAADQDRLLGSVTNAKEDDTGLKFRAIFSKVQRAQDARTKAVEGHLSGVSIGWLPDPGVPDAISFQEGADGIVRVLKAIRLLEISLTPIPANPEAVLTSAKAAISSHGTATSTGGWDGPANERRLPNSAGALRAAHAWRDPDGEADAKATYRFIHHEVGADGAVGAANLTAASTGIGVLNGGRGGTTIPDADRSGVYAHLAKHLRDGDREPPALKALPLDWHSFEASLRAALGLGHGGARRAAVDALVKAYHPEPDDSSAPGTADGPPTADGTASTGTSAPQGQADPPAGTPQATSIPPVEDAAAYAAKFLAPPGPPDGAPGSGPRPAPADPLTALEAERASEQVDRYAAELQQLLEDSG